MAAGADSRANRLGNVPEPGTSELLIHRFARWADASPDQPALICGDASWSYAELARAANCIADNLLARGLEPGALVAVMLEPSPEQVAALIGVAQAGAAYVPLDPDYPDERLRAIAEQAQPAAWLTSTALCPRAIPDAESCLLVDQLLIGAARKEQIGSYPPVAAGDLAYLMFTSGSTGVPKGVVVTHGNIAGLFAALQGELGFGSGDHWSAMHSFAFGFSVWEIWGALTNGGCLHIVPGSMRGDPARWSQLVLDQRVSVLSLTPSAFRQWLLTEQLPEPDDLQDLRLIVFSGEAVRADDLAKWFDRYGTAGPLLVNTYALTETAGRVTSRIYKPGQPPASGDIGYPAPDADIFVLDSGSRQAVAPGEEGELFVGGPMLAKGYLNDPGLTARRFVEIDPGDGILRRCYRTGDKAVRSADGSLRFVGRADEQVKLRGYRIELQDIESVLRQHPDVADAAVVLNQDLATPQLSAWVVPVAKQAEFEFWPSLGEYQVYDDLLYDFMSADETRVASYARAFARHVSGKVVLDIGTGKDAVLARLCAAAGARKVYAVEVLADAARQARDLVARLGLEDQIEVIHGDMQSVELPQAAELCTQGIVGNIGSSDGIVSIWNDARRFFADDFMAVPARCETLMAPAELPLDVRSQPRFGPLAAAYTERIFAAGGAPFDVRLCVRNFPKQGLLAAATVFEDLNFTQELSITYSGEFKFIIDRDGCFDGFLLWTRIHNGDDDSVDFLQHQQAWLPVWFPVADTPVAVSAGQVITARWHCDTPAGQIFPDYRVEADMPGGETLSYCSRHFEEAFRSTGLHRQLLGSLGALTDGIESHGLQEWAVARLPQQMVPARWQLTARLPLNANGKLDRQALACMSASAEPATGAEAAEFASPLEAAIAAIWCGVLGRDSLAPDDDFFAVGGDSILAVRLTTEVQRYLDDTVFLAALFDAPTIASYATWLEQHHAAAVARRLQADFSAFEPVAEPEPGAEHSAGGLSPAQQSLWFLHQLYPENTAANEQFLVRVTGGADCGRLRAAWHTILERHDILRTGFRSEGGVARQDMADFATCLSNMATPEIDLAGLSAAAAEQRLWADAGADIRTPFDLSQAPLLRARIYRLPDDELVLLITAHHIVADGLCVELIRDELAVAYDGTVLPPPELQYADFVASQRGVLESSIVADELAWWQEQLAGHRGKPAVDARGCVSVDGVEARIPFEIPADLADRLRIVAAEEATTLFTVLLAAWRVWLQRCFADDDLLIGTPVTLRRDEKLARVMGCMVNNVAIRNPVSPDASFLSALRAERDAALAAFDHSTVPFDQVVESVEPDRYVGRHPLFQLMFMFEDRSSLPVARNGLRFAADVLPVDRASYWDLELSVTDQGEGQLLRAFIGVREDVFDAGAARSWGEGFVTLLQAIVQSLQQPVGALPLLSRAQRQLMLQDWNATSMSFDDDQSLYSLFVRQARNTPEAIALVDGATTVAYAQLNDEVEDLVAGLIGYGVKRGHSIGLCLGRGARAVALMLAINRCGAAWLPLDPDYPAERLGRMVEIARPLLIVSERTELFSAGQNVLGWDDLLSGSAQVSEDLPVADDTRADAVCILFTSGSTGEPKAVAVKQAGAISRCQWMWRDYGFATADTIALRTSFNFVDSIWEIFGPLIHGSTVAVLPNQLSHDPAGMLAWLQASRVSHLVTVPVLLAGLLDAVEDQGVAGSVHTIITSGEALSSELAKRFSASWPDCRLLNTYGTSETWDATCYELSGPSVGSATEVPVGRPVANASIYVLDESLQALPCGAIGNLYVGGLAVADGYLHDSDLSRDHFLINPFAASDVFYRTGDLARFRSDGELVLTGRADRQIKLRGQRIEAAEIESVAQRFPGVARAIAVLCSEADGVHEDNNWLALFVVAEQRAGSISEHELRSWLRQQLPRAMVPAQITLLDNFPLLPNGKVDLLELERKGDGTLVATSYLAPRNASEQKLVELWQEALGVERVGVHDDFFALRGHSLLATRLIARICDEFAVELPLQCLFETPTVAGLAISLEALRWTTQEASGPSGEPGEREVVRL